MNKHLVLARGMLLLAAFSSLPAGATSQITIHLENAPKLSSYPISPGTNTTLTAIIRGGRARTVWLAVDEGARARILLTRIRHDRYTIDLADPFVVSTLSTAAVKGSFAIFAETGEGEIAKSSTVDYVFRSKRNTARIRVYSGRGKNEFWIGEGTTSWFEPGSVSRIDFVYASGEELVPIEAVIGEVRQTFSIDKIDRTATLVPEGGMQRAWERTGQLSILCAGKECRSLPTSPAGLELTGNAVRLSLAQRRETEVPGSQGFLRIAIGDITAGQVLLEIKRHDGTSFVAQRSVTQGGEVHLRLGKKQYVLTVEKLVNFLIGNDYAVITVSKGGNTERRRILRLIARIGEAKHAFIREGVEVSAGEAMAHVRRKYEQGPRVSTLEEFIDVIASRSSLTGRPYLVKFENGQTVEAAKWLRAQAARMAAEPEKKPSAGGDPDKRLDHCWRHFWSPRLHPNPRQDRSLWT